MLIQINRANIQISDATMHLCYSANLHKEVEMAIITSLSTLKRASKNCDSNEGFNLSYQNKNLSAASSNRNKNYVNSIKVNPLKNEFVDH